MSNIIYKELSDKIIGCAITVHKIVGSGFLENVYEQSLCVELKSVPYINRNMEAQLLNYLHVSKVHVGYVINFRNAVIEFKRLVF